MGDSPAKIECQPWAVTNGISDWSEGSFGVGICTNSPTVEYTRSDLMPKWQPIDTAPKDGTVVDLWQRTTNGKHQHRTPDCAFTEGRWWLGDLCEIEEMVHADGSEFEIVLWSHPLPPPGGPK